MTRRIAVGHHLRRREFLSRSAAALAALSQLPCAGSSSDEEPAPPFRPRFAICNETFEGWPFEKACSLVAECGYRGIEIAPFPFANDVTTISAARRESIRKEAEKAGLEVIGLHWLLARTRGLHLTSPEPEVRKRTSAYLGELARLGADLGGKLLVFGSPQQRNLLPGVSREKGLEYAAEVLRAALPALEKADATLALEPLSPRTTNFLSTAAEAVELIRKLDSPRFRLILDCNAMSSEPTPIPELVRKHRDHLVHFHANDPSLRGPGFGKLEFQPIFRALRDIAYRGWISVEVFDLEPGPERIARESIGYMRRCLEDL